jgi:gamma-glutamyl hercynylcysteine S-oxide hydrolase
MAFSRYSTKGPGNSLYFVEGGEAFPDAVVVASEHLDGDAGWRQVPDRHLLMVDPKGATTLPL